MTIAWTSDFDSLHHSLSKESLVIIILLHAVVQTPLNVHQKIKAYIQLFSS